MSQEWDEVAKRVQLMIWRLDAFCDDLLAAYVGGELTEDQCEIVHNIKEAASACAVHVGLSFTPRRRRESQQGRGETQE